MDMKYANRVLSTLLMAWLGSSFAQTPQLPLETPVREASAPDGSPGDTLSAPQAAAPPGGDATSVNPSEDSAHSAANQEPVLKKPGSDYALGILSIVAGVAMLPLGLLVSIGNSFDKCEENDGEIFTGGFGPCSKSGPSRGGQFMGAGITVGGVVLIGTGFHILGRDGRAAEAKR